MSTNIKAPYASQVNKRMECALTAPSVYACDKVNLNKPCIRYPSRIEFSYANNECEIKTDRKMNCRPVDRTHDMRKTKDLASTSTENTIPTPQSPVLVNGHLTIIKFMR